MQTNSQPVKREGRGPGGRAPRLAGRLPPGVVVRPGRPGWPAGSCAAALWLAGRVVCSCQMSSFDLIYICVSRAPGRTFNVCILTSCHCIIADMADLTNLTFEQLAAEAGNGRAVDVCTELIRRNIQKDAIIDELRQECEMLTHIQEALSLLRVQRRPCLPCHAQARLWG